jgi:hypothetical protein
VFDDQRGSIEENALMKDAFQTACIERMRKDRACVLVERVQGREVLRFVCHGFYGAGGLLKSASVKKRETNQSCSACCICSSLPAKK